MKKQLVSLGVALLMGASLAASASAGTILRASYQDAALSIDGWGSQLSQSGQIQTNIAAGSTVLGAYLYSADVWGGGVAGDVTLNGTFLSSASGTLLNQVSGNPVHVKVYDVTSILKSAIEATGGLQNFSISENGYTDGEVLVVAYKNASTVGGTAIIMDGGLSQGGDTTRLNFANPYAGGGSAILSLASSFSYGDSQYTNVDVRTSSTPTTAASRRLTSAAGGNNDGNFEPTDGALITVGGVGDSTDNPANPNQRGAAYDDELYDLAKGNDANANPFLNVGDTWVELATNNPSFDDNVFGTFFSTSFKITDVIDDSGDVTHIDDTTPVPEPGTFLLLGAGLAGLGFYRRRAKK